MRDSSDFTAVRRNVISAKTGVYKYCGIELVDANNCVFTDNVVDDGVITSLTALIDNNIGNVLATQANAARDRNKLQQAIAFTEKAEATLQSLADGDPSNVFYWSNLAVDDYNLSVLNASLGNKSAQQAYAAKSQQAQQHAQAKPASTAQPSPPAQQQ